MRLTKICRALEPADDLVLVLQTLDGTLCNYIRVTEQYSKQSKGLLA